MYETCGYIPAVPARGGAEVALGIYYKTFLIYRTCMRRAPARPVRAFCESGVLFQMSHLKLHFTLHTSHSTLRTPHFTLHTSHFTLHSSHSTLHFTLHSEDSRLHTSHSTLHTSHSTLHSSHCFLHTFTFHTPHFTLHTALFTPHTSHFTLRSSHSTLHTPHFISSELFSPLSQLISSHLTSSRMSSKLSEATSQYYFALQDLHKVLPYYVVLQTLRKGLPSRTLCYRACTKYFTVPRDLHKALPSTLYYKACTAHFPVLLCTTKLAQSAFQYYFVLQSLHKVLPGTTLSYKACTKYFRTTLYYKACTKHFPVLLCTTKLAQSTSQHYFVLQSLHSALPSTTLYYKTCTKYFPILLCTTKLAQRTSQYYLVLQSLHKVIPCIYFFVLQSVHTSKLLHNEDFTQRNFLVHHGSRKCSSKTGSRRQSEKKTIWKHFLKNFSKENPNAKLEKKCWQITIAALMQPFHYDFQCPAARDNSITHAVAATSNLDAATTMRYRDIELQNTIERRATVWETAHPKPDLGAKEKKKHDFEALLKRNLNGKSPAPKLRKFADESLSRPWCSHSNTIYNAQLQKTIVLRTQLRHQAALTQPLLLMAIPDDNNHAAIPTRSATTDSRIA